MRTDPSGIEQVWVPAGMFQMGTDASAIEVLFADGRFFHRFYADCRVLGDDDGLTQARLWVCRAAEQVIANVLSFLGVSAPESMEREAGGSDGSGESAPRELGAVGVDDAG